ncbi:MAG: hypothetical protein QM706_07035 [Nitrospira sp.]
MRKKIAPIVLACLAASAVAQDLPAQFEHGRIHLAVTAPDQSTVRFYTDSGGGWNAIGKTAAERLQLKVVDQLEDGKQKFDMVDFPAWATRAGVPAPSYDPGLKGRLAVVPDRQVQGDDGFLGFRWFAGRVWKIDYPKQSFSALPKFTPTADDHPVGLGFQTDDNGKRVLDFPRVVIVVDGKPIDVLLDTGATAKLSEGAASAFQLKPGTLVGTSYIIKTIFDEWRKSHPHWRVIEDAETVTGRAYPMIEVPQVSMAGVTLGPVWFAQRPDVNFHGMMSEMMDKQVQGAIGGSGLKYLRLVLDYPGAMAYVQKPR